MPRLPKPPELRQRTNRASTAAVLPPKPEAKVPPLPNRTADGQAWRARTKAWWREIWSSPMATQWLDADREQLYMALELVEQFWRKPSAGILRELRAVLAAFGLDPIARRRLDWRIAPAPKPEKERPAPSQGAAHAGDDRDALGVN